MLNFKNILFNFFWWSYSRLFVLVFSLYKACTSVSKVSNSFFNKFNSSKLLSIWLFCSFSNDWFSALLVLRNKTASWQNNSPFYFCEMAFWSDKSAIWFAKNQPYSTLLPLLCENNVVSLHSGRRLRSARAKCFWAFSPRVACFAIKIAFFSPRVEQKVRNNNHKIFLI